MFFVTVYVHMGVVKQHLSRLCFFYRETQELRQDLRESPDVQFVIKVFYALNSNNYVRFFKLVKHASFLNACIMHRYFNQVRSRALWTMLKAYYMKAKVGTGMFCKSGFPGEK